MQQFKHLLMVGAVALLSLANGSITAHGATLHSLTPSMAMAITHTQQFTYSPQNQGVFNSPLTRLKHINFKQVEQNAGPLFGRFYQERVLINDPVFPAHNFKKPEPKASNNHKDTTYHGLLTATLTSIPAFPQPEEPLTQLLDKTSTTPSGSPLDTRAVDDTISPTEATSNKLTTTKPLAKASKLTLSPKQWFKNFKQMDMPINELQLFVAP
jgi:hypothetical protein